MGPISRPHVRPSREAGCSYGSPDNPLTPPSAMIVVGGGVRGCVARRILTYVVLAFRDVYRSWASLVDKANWTEPLAHFPDYQGPLCQ